MELKEEIPGSFRALMRTWVAIANYSGGDPIIGVRDSDLEITGVPLVGVEKFLEDFLNVIHQAGSASLFATSLIYTTTPRHQTNILN